MERLTLRMYLYFFIFAAKLIMLSGVARADTTLVDSDKHLQYVNGSWVNVRLQPTADANVIDHIVINTQVMVETKATVNDFCRISYGDGKHGYVACRLLGDKPTTLQDLGVPYDGQGQNSLYSYTRAFWIQPSVDRLIATGKYFERTMLRPGELDAERVSAHKNSMVTEIRRSTIPEYEAMKSHLQKGVIGALDDDYHPLTTWQEIKNNGDHIYFYGRGFNYGENVNYRELLRAVELPSVEHSYFSNDKEIIPPGTSTETVSALLGIPYRADVISGPIWVTSHEGETSLYGAWDTGLIETRLTSPVLKHTLSRDGNISTDSTDISIKRFPNEDSDGCIEGFALGDAGATIQDPINPGPRLFYFFSKSVPPYSTANVTHENHKLSITGFIEAETIRFDIDRDGIDDIYVWEGTGIPKEGVFVHKNPAAYFRMFFVNIDGSWFLFRTDEYVYACNC